MDIKLGQQCWCVLKTSLVDENKIEKPEFLVHLAVGYVTSKGVQFDTDGVTTIPYIEMCGQRLKAQLVFGTQEAAIERMNDMIAEISQGTNPVPSVA